MKRLRDMEGDEPLFQRGVEVLRRVPPTPRAADVKDRVWRSLQRATVRAPRRMRILILEFAVVMIVAFAAGTAGAVIARRWIVPKLVADASPARASLPAPSLPAARPEKTSPIQADVHAATDTADESRSPKSPGRSASKKLASPPPSAAAVARERTEVLDALIALRREHDPVRAGALLSRYLSAHPRGALREEALVLAIEAADARTDRAGGAQLAHVYQDEFPAGRFLPFARSHTDARSSH